MFYLKGKYCWNDFNKYSYLLYRKFYNSWVFIFIHGRDLQLYIYICLLKIKKFYTLTNKYYYFVFIDNMLIKLEISHFSLFIVYIMFVVWHIYHVNIYKLSFSRFLHPTKTAIFEEIFSKNIFWKSVKKIFFIGYFHGLLNNMLIFWCA